MIEAREAVRRAIDGMRDLTGDPRSEHALLEEIELVREDGSAHWAVTISVPAGLAVLSSLASLSGEYKKDYKVVTIDADSGAFVSMKIRNV